MNSNNHNSSCNFSELLVSYLYGEIGEQEKSRFESHVSTCGVCADEVSAFGGVRSSVLDWREKEFSTLSVPVIELPFETEKAVLSTETITASRSWLAGWRDLFSLSPAWAGAATACAALAICAGLFYVAFSSLSIDRNMAGTNKNVSVSSVPAPTVDDKNTTSNAGTGDNQTPDETPKPELITDKKRNSPKTAPVVEKAVVTGNTNVKPVKTNNSPKSVNKEKPATNVVKKASKQTDIEFSTREEEDKSLRLTDLFDEVSMR